MLELEEAAALMKKLDANDISYTYCKQENEEGAEPALCLVCYEMELQSIH